MAALTAGFGCGASQSEQPSPAPATAAAPSSARPPERPLPSPTGLSDRDWGEYTSSRLALRLPLPDRSSWRVDDHTERWLVVAHPRSKSELRARAWRAARLVKPGECEQQARLWLPELPRPAPESVLEARQFEAPDGYRTELVVGVHPGPGESLEGYALAFGATVGRCRAVVYITRAHGTGAEIAVGRRLRLVADAVVPRVTSPSVDERAHGQRIER